MATLENKIKAKSAKLGVVGLGYVGLPLACAFAEAGYNVIGIEKSKEKCQQVNAGKSYICDVSDARLAQLAKNGNPLRATDDDTEIHNLDAVSICVPTPLTRTKDPDLTFIIQVARAVVRRMKSPALVILESTTYPGTTRQDVLPILKSKGAVLDKDFFLAFSPEMVDPGNKVYHVRNMPKVVGGITPRSTELARLLYSQIASAVYPVSSPEVAEMVKVFSNVFRNINIALVNELAQLCQRMGISVWEVIDTTAKKPFGFMPFYPGPGTGGHCIPKDPYYLANKAREIDFHTKFIELAADINEQMPYYTVNGVTDALNNRGKSLKDALVLVLGVAYKKDIEDTRESPSFKVIELLQKKHAKVIYNDPYVPQLKMNGHSMKSVDLDGYLEKADCIVITTDHTSYNIPDIVAKAKLVFDTRGVTRRFPAPNGNVVRLGE